MVTWVEQVHKRASAFQNQIAAARISEASSGTNLSGIIELFQYKLEELYLEEMPLAQIKDASDLMFHAEGPSTATNTPGLHAFNWLCTTAEKQIKHLAKSIFNISDMDSKRLVKNLDLRFSGFAPGSIYAGFHVSPVPSVMGSAEPEAIYSTLKRAIRQLPTITDFIEDEGLSYGITDLIPDPAMRDASLEAVFRLSPTGRAGIHTVDISSPDAGQGELGGRERIVLREALRTPIAARRFQGRFVGEVREVDLDSGRFHLKGIPGIGTLRCVLPGVSNTLGQRMLGNVVCVTGEYETNEAGKPRLMFAHEVTHVQEISDQFPIMDD